MTDDRDVVTWVGLAPCGCALFCCVDAEPGTSESRHNDIEIAALRRKGWTIEKRTVGWVRDGGMDFRCPHRKARKVKRNDQSTPLLLGEAT